MGGSKCWLYHSGSQDLNNLLLKISTDFTKLKDNPDIDLDDIINTITRSFPRSDFDQSILQHARSSDNDAEMHLVASLIEVSDILDESIECNNLLLPIFYYDCLEDIVHLAQHSVNEVLQSSQLRASHDQSLRASPTGNGKCIAAH